MSRQRFLVTYDIADPKRLKAVHKVMLGFGDHVQLSVFLCELNAREFLQMEHRLKRVLNHRQDQALIFELGPATEQRLDAIQSIGRSFIPSARVLIA